MYSENSHCSAFGGGTNDGRDCMCADRAFSDCHEPGTEDQVHVEDLAECKFQCDVSDLNLLLVLSCLSENHDTFEELP